MSVKNYILGLQPKMIQFVDGWIKEKRKFYLQLREALKDYPEVRFRNCSGIGSC